MTSRSPSPSSTAQHHSSDIHQTSGFDVQEKSQSLMSLEQEIYSHYQDNLVKVFNGLERKAADKDQKLIEEWGTEVVSLLQTPKNPGFNFIYHLNHSKIMSVMEPIVHGKGGDGKLVEQVVRRYQFDRQIRSSYTANALVLKMKLVDVLTGRWWSLKDELAKVSFALTGDDQAENFRRDWVETLVSALKTSQEYFTIDGNWYKIQAVLSHLRETIYNHQLQHRKTMTLEDFEKAFGTDKLVESMALSTPSHPSRPVVEEPKPEPVKKAKQFQKAYNQRKGCWPFHSIGIRQLQMHRLEDYGENLHGGRWFLPSCLS